MPVGENDDFGEISHSKDGYDSGGIYDSRYDTTLTDDERINWGYFRAHIDLFYDMGEYGVIYTDKRSPYHVLKMANCDVTDGESNWKMADFLLENWKRNIEGLVDITCVYVGTCDAFHRELFMKIKRATNDPAVLQKARNVLDLDEGDEILMVRMEKLPYLGLTHPDLSKEEMIKRVAEAAYNISIQTGMYLDDLKPANFGFRKDGSAAIFDFNLEESVRSKEEYRKKITDASLEHAREMLRPAH